MGNVPIFRPIRAASMWDPALPLKREIFLPLIIKASVCDKSSLSPFLDFFEILSFI